MINDQPITHRRLPLLLNENYVLSAPI